MQRSQGLLQENKSKEKYCAHVLNFMKGAVLQSYCQIEREQNREPSDEDLTETENSKQDTDDNLNQLSPLSLNLVNNSSETRSTSKRVGKRVGCEHGRNTSSSLTTSWAHSPGDCNTDPTAQDSAAQLSLQRQRSERTSHKRGPKSVRGAPTNDTSISEGRGSSSTLLAQLRYKMVILLLIFPSASAEHVQPCNPLLCSDTSWNPSMCKMEVLSQWNATFLGVPTIAGNVTCTWPQSRAGLCHLEACRFLHRASNSSCVALEEHRYCICLPGGWVAASALRPPGNSSCLYCHGVDCSNTWSNLRFSHRTRQDCSGDGYGPLPPESGGVFPLLSLEFPFLLHSLTVLALCLFIKLRHPLGDAGEVAWEELEPGRGNPGVGTPVEESFPPLAIDTMCVCLRRPSPASLFSRLHHGYASSDGDQGDTGDMDDAAFLTSTVEHDDNPTSASVDDPQSLSSDGDPGAFLTSTVEQDDNPTSVDDPQSLSSDGDTDDAAVFLTSTVEEDDNPTSVDVDAILLATNKAREAVVQTQIVAKNEIVAKKASWVVDVVVSASQNLPTVLRAESNGKLEEGSDMDQRRVHIQDNDHSECNATESSEGDEAVATVPSKITLDGHKEKTIFNKLEVVTEASVLYRPNPPPSTSGICMPRSRNGVFAETGVGFMDSHGLGVHGCSVGPASVLDDLEFLPVVDIPMEVGNNDKGLFDCCLDHEEMQHFQGQYGPN